jgi:Na+-transporting methylmalonyl-CoA/oxaloacetate decarboxylase gamma subunit
MMLVAWWLLVLGVGVVAVCLLHLAAEMRSMQAARDRWRARALKAEDALLTLQRDLYEVRVAFELYKQRVTGSADVTAQLPAVREVAT